MERPVVLTDALLHKDNGTFAGGLPQGGAGRNLCLWIQLSRNEEKRLEEFSEISPLWMKVFCHAGVPEGLLRNQDRRLR